MSEHRFKMIRLFGGPLHGRAAAVDMTNRDELPARINLKDMVYARHGRSAAYVHDPGLTS